MLQDTTSWMCRCFTLSLDARFSASLRSRCVNLAPKPSMGIVQHRSLHALYPSIKGTNVKLLRSPKRAASEVSSKRRDASVLLFFISMKRLASDRLVTWSNGIGC